MTRVAQKDWSDTVEHRGRIDWNVTSEVPRPVTGTSSGDDSARSGDPSAIVLAWGQDGALVRYATGIEPLDKLCRGGLPFPWRMVIVGAPSAGKTYLLVCIAFALLKQRVAVGPLCVDEEPEDILLRFGVLLGFSKAELEERGEDTLARLSNAIAELPLRLYDASDGILTAAAKLDAFRTSQGLAHAMLGVDSLQAVTPSTQADTPRAIVEANVRDVRAASHQYRHLVLATSEANRAFYKSRTPDADDAVGAMAAGAESRAVEFGFKTLLGVLTPKGHNDVAEVEVAKNRRHHRGKFWLRPERDTHTVTECPDPTGTPEAVADRESAAIGAKAARVRADAKILARIVQHEPGIGERSLRAALKVDGHGWGPERIDTPKRLLMSGELGPRLVNRSDNLKRCEWYL